MFNRFLPDTIRGQVLTGFMLLYLLTTIPLFLAVVTMAERNIERDRADDFIVRVELVAALAPVGSDASSVRLLQNLSRTSGMALAVYVNGWLISSATAPNDVPPADFPPSQITLPIEVILKDGESALYVTTLPEANEAVLLAVADIAAVNVSTRELWAIAIAGLALSAGVFGLAGWWLARRSTDSLATLRDHAIAVVSGDSESTGSVTGTRAVRDLTSAINTLGDRINALSAESEDSRRRLEMIFEHLREGVLVVDGAETVIAENPRAREILGNQGRSGIGLLFAVVVRDHDLLEQMRVALTSMTPTTLPVEYARSGRSIEATAIPMEGEHRDFCVVVLRDVTDFRRLELVRREFVANVSHELRTPLASIRALADTLESGAIDDREVAIDFLHRIVDEVDRLTALVEELLDLARLESGRVNLVQKPAPAGEVIRAGVERLRPQIDRAGLTIDLRFEGVLPVVNVDQQRIEQVLINLLHNAVKFTPSGGSIMVVAREDGGGLRVDVHDTGTGIPEEELSRVFERFYKADRSRRSEGTGLGLAISKHIIRAHHGELWATSVVNEGSTFSFWLPGTLQTPGELPQHIAIESRSGD